ncbi:hypothetical protein BUY42_03530 [Staphylococcus devriesei]|uniref:hypothetical protein n=1 Tax=Staphylococcus devriesei TaxID=586733 RepID=UPI000D1CEED9|nr:hypothetical protein [Staphylococcus devriesei]PTF19468.1 hypothetical protein BUY42_03530 [Staphylococcus devriesei]WKU13013.1 hypothetical protein Q2T90_09690 [Staphylococcus devriesei]
MGLRDKFYLFDNKGNKMLSVIPRNHDGLYRVSGIIRTYYEGKRWFLNKDELETFIKNENLNRGYQMSLFEYL